MKTRGEVYAQLEASIAKAREAGLQVINTERACRTLFRSACLVPAFPDDDADPDATKTKIAGILFGDGKIVVQCRTPFDHDTEVNVPLPLTPDNVPSVLLVDDVADTLLSMTAALDEALIRGIGGGGKLLDDNDCSVRNEVTQRWGQVGEAD